MKNLKVGIIALFIILGLVLAGCDNPAVSNAVNQFLGGNEEDEGELDLQAITNLVGGNTFDLGGSFSSTVTGGYYEDGHFEKDIIEEGYSVAGHWDREILEEGHFVEGYFTRDLIEEGYSVPGYYDRDLIEEGYSVPGYDVDPVYGEPIPAHYDPLGELESAVTTIANSMSIPLFNTDQEARGTVTATKNGNMWNYVLTLEEGADRISLIDIQARKKTGNFASVSFTETTISNLNSYDELIITANEEKWVDEEEVILEPGYYVPGYDVDPVYGEEYWVDGYDVDPVYGEEYWVDGHDVGPVYGLDFWVPGYDVDPVYGEDYWVDGRYVPFVISNTTREIPIAYDFINNKFVEASSGLGLIIGKETITDNEDGTLTVSFVFEEGIAELIRALYCVAGGEAIAADYEYTKDDEVRGFTGIFTYDSGDTCYLGIRVQF